ncbi:MAG TPA: hypothetical protein VHS36_09465 [Candidatus Limnocylindrales bacterium]|nr:hypothetical protein [Candidatus Limnocylindrales bacterium]
MSGLPPPRPFSFAMAALVVAVVATGCRGSFPPTLEGLVVAAGGHLSVTDGSGALESFDGPPGPVTAVATAAGRVVAATADRGLATATSTGGRPGTWTSVRSPVGFAGGPPLMALSPAGGTLALAIGVLQGERFELILLDLGTGTSRTIAVARGLNGAPAWIGPGTIAIDVIGPAGTSEIATIDLASRMVADGVGNATVVSATADGQRIAVGDTNGDVLVGDAASWRRGEPESMTKLPPATAAAVEALALSPDSTRLAIVRRDDVGTPSLELLWAVGRRWVAVRAHTLTSDGPVSIGWLR